MSGPEERRDEAARIRLAEKRATDRDRELCYMQTSGECDGCGQGYCPLKG